MITFMDDLNMPAKDTFGSQVFLLKMMWETEASLTVFDPCNKKIATVNLECFQSIKVNVEKIGEKIGYAMLMSVKLK